MASHKKRKRILAVNHYEFETFVRTNLSTDLVDIILVSIGIGSYVVLLQCYNLNVQLLDVYDVINEKDKLNLFLYPSIPSTRHVKTAILKELKIF